jgi:AraC family transcriptional regulator of adaptative response/methylated-DNA-[protein]-cysteine methyltransferase
MQANQKTSAAESIRYEMGDSALDRVLVAQSDVGVCAILFGSDDQKMMEELRRAFPAANIERDAGLAPVLQRVMQLIERPGEPCDLPLDIRGTRFEKLVWQALGTIEPGTTASYGDIARRIGDPRVSREVAEACAANTLAVAIPCHRVIKKDGAISGYRWGFNRKRQLLKREVELYAQDRLI